MHRSFPCRRLSLFATAFLAMAACVGVPAWKEPKLEKLAPPAESLPLLVFSQQAFYEGELDYYNRRDPLDRLTWSRKNLEVRALAIAQEAGFHLGGQASPSGEGALRVELNTTLRQENLRFGCNSPLDMFVPCKRQFTFTLSARITDNAGEITIHHLSDSLVSKEGGVYLLFAMPFAEYSSDSAESAVLDNLYRHVFKNIIEEDVPAYRARQQSRPAVAQAQAVPNTRSSAGQLRGVAVYPLTAKGGASAATAEALGGLLQSEIAASPCVRIVAEDVVRDLARQQGLEQQCGTEQCQIDLARQARADVLVRGDLLKVGSAYVLTALAVDLASNRTLFSEKIQSGEDGLIAAAEALGKKAGQAAGCGGR